MLVIEIKILFGFNIYFTVDRFTIKMQQYLFYQIGVAITC